MDDSQRLAFAAPLGVGVVKGRRHIHSDLDSMLKRKSLLSLAHFRQHAANVVAVDVLHREVVLTPVIPDVIDAGDVVMVKLAGKPGLIHEHVANTFLFRQLRKNSLDDHMALESLGATSARQVDLRHASLGQEGYRLVLSEGRRSHVLQLCRLFTEAGKSHCSCSPPSNLRPRFASGA
jgi:hypothetical protein